MKRIVHTALCILLVCFVSLSIHAQQTTTDNGQNQTLSYIRHAMRFSRFYPQEKVYLHLDNNGYFKGETIWFKAYVKRCDTDKRTDLSQVLYVELVNPSGDVVEKRKLHIVNGEAYGDIKVDSIMTTGFYEIRAYTRYMTNWGTNACFSRVIPIFKAPKVEGDYSTKLLDKFSYRHRLNNERLSAADDDKGNVKDLIQQDDATDNNERGSSVKVRFFPEGGSMVKGLPGRVAFLAYGKDGIPVKATCEIRDTDDRLITSAHTDSKGRGEFMLTPQSEGAYMMVMYNGKTKKVNLPEYVGSGCSMTVDMMQDDSIRVDIRVTDDILGMKQGYVMIHNGQIIRCDTMTAETCRHIAFNRSILPDGVSQLTLFGSDGRIMAERLFFNLGKAKNTPNVKITSKTKSIKPCGKMTFDIQSLPNSSISFSAIDSKGMVNGSSGNINTWMLLSSELRGYISNPEYYFEADDEEHRKASDLLMLTQGWRRYDWNLYSGCSMIVDMQPIEDRLRIYGKVKGKTKKKPVSNVSLTSTLYRQKDGIYEGAFNTDSMGRYAFDVPDIDGEWSLQIASKYKEKAVDYMIGIDRNFVPKSRYLSAEETDIIPIAEDRAFKWNVLEDDEKTYTSITKKNHVLKNVTVKAKGRVWDRTGWSDEKSAKYFSQIYYDCDAAMEKIEDEGEYPPAVIDWLKSKNSFFNGEDPTDILIYLAVDPATRSGRVDTIAAIQDWFEPDDGHYSEYENMPPGPNMKFYRDGLSYKNRPIVWIVDNEFVTVTNFRLKGRKMYMNISNCDNPTNALDVPISLDEVKSIYITEDARSMLSHCRCNEIEEMNPVVMYCYTHRKSQYKQKGVRYTHFEGYNVPSVFQMEDYSVIPPVEDFRRTLYWNPTVKTDAKGHATVEFYNNSSCKEMFLSTEGMTENGEYIYY